MSEQKEQQPGRHLRLVDPGPQEVEPYAITAAFERLITAAACTRAAFWPALDGTFQIDGVRHEAAQLALGAVQQIVHETGSGPSSISTVLQRLRTQQDDGKLTKAQVKQAKAFIMEGLEAPLPPDAEILNELLPMLRRRLQQRALDEGYQQLVNRGDLSVVEEQLSRARRLGSAPAITGQRVDASGFEAIRRLAKLQRLATGIEELDDELGGGYREGEYWLYAGGFASGKSMMLNQMFGSALQQGINAALASVGELSVDLQFARLAGNLTGLPINDLLDDMMPEGERRLGELTRGGRLAAGTIGYFPAESTVSSILRWVRLEERRLGGPIEALFVDYADRLAPEDPKATRVAGQADKEIADGLRNAMDRARHPDLHLRWVQSATQIKGAAHDRKRTRRVEGHHVSGGIDKARICDGMWTLNPEEGGEAIKWFLTKNRTGKGGATIGPLPTEFALGRAAVPAAPAPF